MERKIINDPFGFIGTSSKLSTLDKHSNPTKAAKKSNQKKLATGSKSSLDELKHDGAKPSSAFLKNSNEPDFDEESGSLFVHATFVIEIDQREALRNVAYWERRPMGELVREIFHEFLKTKKPKQRPTTGRPPRILTPTKEV